MMITPEIRSRIDEVPGRYPHPESALLPALHIAQRALGGYIPNEALPRRTRIVSCSMRSSIAQSLGM